MQQHAIKDVLTESVISNKKMQFVNNFIHPLHASCIEVETTYKMVPSNRLN